MEKSRLFLVDAYFCLFFIRRKTFKFDENVKFMWNTENHFPDFSNPSLYFIFAVATLINFFEIFSHSSILTWHYCSFNSSIGSIFTYTKRSDISHFLTSWRIAEDCVILRKENIKRLFCVLAFVIATIQSLNLQHRWCGNLWSKYPSFQRSVSSIV
jgi:hypothetical protein